MAEKTVIAGSSVTASQLKDLFRQIAEGGITSGHLQALLERKNPFATDGFGDMFPVTISYSRTLANMIKAGKYDLVGTEITAKNFPQKRGGIAERNLTLYHPNRDIDSKGVGKVLDAMGKEPASIEDLLAFGEQYPEEQRKYPIVALGSSTQVHDLRNVPYLGREGAKRRIDVGWCDGWKVNCRFLARNKVSVTQN